MGNLIVSDNAATTLAGSITNSPSVSSISLIDASKFPVVNHGGTGDDWSYVTLFDSSNNLEIAKVVRRDNGSNNLSILRGTAAGVLGVTDANCRTWASGDTGVACRLVAQVVNDLFDTTADAQAEAAAASASSASASDSAAAAAASAAIVELPSTTRMPFAQAAAPTGWTQDTTDAADNRMLRVVKTAGAGVAGLHSPILNNVVPSHTHSFTTGVNSADHTHAVNDPGHTHSYSAWNNNSGGSSGAGSYNWLYTSMTTGSKTTGITLGNNSADHTHSGTVNANASAANWTPRYIDLILCTKN